MKINTIQTFTNNNKNYRPSFRSTSANEAVLAIQNPDVTQFKRNMQRTIEADAVISNPLKALSKKLGKSLDVLFRPTFREGKLTDPALDQLIEERRYYL